MDYILWTIGLLYVIACVFFVVCFLANIADEDQAGWMVSAITTLVMTFVLKPILLAGPHASAVTAAELWKPEVMNQARLQLGIKAVSRSEEGAQTAERPTLFDEETRNSVEDIETDEIPKAQESSSRLPADCEEGSARRPHVGNTVSRFLQRQGSTNSSTSLPMDCEEGTVRIPHA